MEAWAAVPKPELFDPGTAADVAAAQSGVIESIRVFSGTPMSAEGNAVTSGQILIRGNQVSPHARGEVRAYTYYELTASAPLTRHVKEYTGVKRTRFLLILGEKRINISFTSGIMPPDCDKMIREWTLQPENALLFPVRIEMDTWISYTLWEENADPRLLQRDLEQMLSDSLAKMISEDGEILERRFSTAVLDGRLTVTLRGKCLERIDTDVPRL